MGVQRFFYKVSAERKCNTAWTTFAFMTTVTLLSAVFFLIAGDSVTDLKRLTFIALLNSMSFVLGTITHIEALKNIPTSIAYPIIRLNAVIVVLFSIIYFKDRISVYQVIGIVIAMSVIFILTRATEDQTQSYQNKKRGLLLVFISLFCGATAAITSKFAAMYTNKLAFMTLSYFIGALFSYGVREKMATSDVDSERKEAWIIGFIMGLFNFSGFYAFLKALSVGPLSIIASIMGMHFMVPILLSAVIYKEKLTTLRITGILLTILSIIFLRL